MAKKQTFMSRVKAYRKEHPRCSQVDAMKKLAGKKVGTTVKATKRVPSGYKRGNSTGPSQVHTGTLTISGTRKRKAAPKARKITGTAPARKISTSHTENVIKLAKLIGSKIDRMENQYKAEKTKDVKHIIALAINAEHAKLNRLKTQLKKQA
jgi:hypothetical protein